MIVLRLEMWPGGRKERKFELCTMTLANIGGDEKKGDYSVYLFRRPPKGSTTDVHQEKPLRTATVKGHSRLAQHVLKLIKKAVEELWQ